MERIGQTSGTSLATGKASLAALSLSVAATRRTRIMGVTQNSQIIIVFMRALHRVVLLQIVRDVVNCLECVVEDSREVDKAVEHPRVTLQRHFNASFP